MTSEPSEIVVSRCDPAAPQARTLAAALWSEIQRRYGFEAPDPFDPARFADPAGGFWVAMHGTEPVGSVALAPLEAGVAELEVMYVAPGHRARGIARALLAALEEHARAAGIVAVRLRAGEPQPEAMHFYRAAGFRPIPPFGKWAGDPTARCFEKVLRPTG